MRLQQLKIQSGCIILKQGKPVHWVTIQGRRIPIVAGHAEYIEEKPTPAEREELEERAKDYYDELCDNILTLITEMGFEPTEDFDETVWNFNQALLRGHPNLKSFAGVAYDVLSAPEELRREVLRELYE